MPTTEPLKERFERYLAGKSKPAVEDEEMPEGITFWDSYYEFVKEPGRMNDWTTATRATLSPDTGRIFSSSTEINQSNKESASKPAYPRRRFIGLPLT